MFNFLKKKNKSKVRFYNMVPGVSSLHPVTSSSDLDREWIAEEKKQYSERLKQCPMKKFAFQAYKPAPGAPQFVNELWGMASSPEHAIRENKMPTSIGKCPALNTYMRSGYILHAPADFAVYTNGDGETLEVSDNRMFPGKHAAFPNYPYLDKHGSFQSEWLRDSTKDTTFNTIIKVNTQWRVMCDKDIVFLVTKVPFVKESRFTAVTGILDPRIAPECNVQLWWHVKNDEITIKAGTPLAMYFPVSRSLLDDIDLTVEDATNDDRQMEQEYHYLLNSCFAENRHPGPKSGKIFDKYWKKYNDRS